LFGQLEAGSFRLAKIARCSRRVGHILDRYAEILRVGLAVGGLDVVADQRGARHAARMAGVEHDPDESARRAYRVERVADFVVEQCVRDALRHLVPRLGVRRQKDFVLAVDLGLGRQRRLLRPVTGEVQIDEVVRLCLRGHRSQSRENVVARWLGGGISEARRQDRDVGRLEWHWRVLGQIVADQRGVVVRADEGEPLRQVWVGGDGDKHRMVRPRPSRRSDHCTQHGDCRRGQQAAPARRHLHVEKPPKPIKPNPSHPSPRILAVF